MYNCIGKNIYKTNKLQINLRECVYVDALSFVSCYLGCFLFFPLMLLRMISTVKAQALLPSSACHGRAC